jgi:hypothetical protein
MKNAKIKASKAVRAFLSEIGKKGGHAGKGSPATVEKMRKATIARLMKRKARLENKK